MKTNLLVVFTVLAALASTPLVAAMDPPTTSKRRRNTNQPSFPSFAPPFKKQKFATQESQQLYLPQLEDTMEAPLFLEEEPLSSKAITAIEKDDFDTLAECLAQGLNPRGFYWYNKPSSKVAMEELRLVNIAILNNAVKSMELLNQCDWRSFLEVTYNRKRSYLFYAISWKKIIAIKCLLKHAPILAIMHDKNEVSPLTFAIEKGYMEIAHIITDGVLQYYNPPTPTPLFHRRDEW